MKPFSILDSFTVAGRALALGLTLSALAGTVPAAWAQTASIHHSPALREAAAQKAGVSPERLARIDALCEQAIREGRIPGAVALVARNGKVVYHKAFGMADNQAGRALKRDDIFRIASQTKAITSTAVMMLWEEGRFRLDDPVSNWIPEFKKPQVLKTYNEADGTWTGEPAKREITLRDLLTHTSGLGYGVIDGDARFKKLYAKAGVVDLFTTEPVTLRGSVLRLAKLPLHHHPGEKFTYSEGLDVLGYFIAVVSGMPFDVFLQKRLFGPLGMKDTGFHLPAEVGDGVGSFLGCHAASMTQWVTAPATIGSVSANRCGWCVRMERTTDVAVGRKRRSEASVRTRSEVLAPPRTKICRIPIRTRPH